MADLKQAVKPAPAPALKVTALPAWTEIKHTATGETTQLRLRSDGVMLKQDVRFNPLTGSPAPVVAQQFTAQQLDANITKLQAAVDAANAELAKMQAIKDAWDSVPVMAAPAPAQTVKPVPY